MRTDSGTRTAGGTRTASAMQAAPAVAGGPAGLRVQGAALANAATGKIL
jgi:hypothetical protein